MATVTARLAVLGENAPVDQEKDANSLLLELEKGLRSNKVGEQCEAIVRFPGLFEKYPFPIFINSAFLKLGDVFRGGTNILRFQILRVAQQSVKHLDKIQNVDEFVQRIFYVIHSNHAVARAITLRTLGSIARIISERKNVHHSIINGLDSNDAIEIEAAIYAALHFTEQSKTFAVSICNKLSDMISGLVTPVDMKLKLIPIFQHMHHDPATTEKARQLCTEFLKQHPALDAVMVALHTLSKLAAASLLDLPDQVALLLQYLREDPRRAVQTLVLRDLRLLAARGPHMWAQQHIQEVCQYIQNMPFAGLKIGALNVLTSLSGSVAVTKFNLKQGCDDVMESCVWECCYHTNVAVASRGCTLLTDVAVATVKGLSTSEEEAVDSASVAVECLLSVTCTEDNNEDASLAALKSCLLCIVKLCEACPSVTDRFVDSIITTLPNVSAGHALLLCGCLSSISSKQNVHLHSLIPDLVHMLRKQLTTDQNTLTVSMVTLLFQACVGSGLEQTVEEVINDVLGAVDCWTAYKIGRQAARYGHHRKAAQVFAGLASKVSTENFDYWLRAVSSCCDGEACLAEMRNTETSVAGFIKRVTAATNHYQRGLASLKAATMPGQQVGKFQCQYVGLRIQQMAAYVQLVKGCCSFQTSPPPAIATSLAVTTGSDKHRCQHVLQQLEKCRRQFEELGQQFGDLYQASFDADPASLNNIHILQQSCQVIIHVLNTILTKAQKPGSSLPVMSSSLSLPPNSSLLECQPWQDTSTAIQKHLQKVCSMDAQLPLTHQNWKQQNLYLVETAQCEGMVEVEAARYEQTLPAPSSSIRPVKTAGTQRVNSHIKWTLTESQHMQCVIGSAMQFCSTPLCLPRYFFQKLQHTDIKLAISPQVKTQGDTIPVHFDTNLTLKVEGVIQHAGKAGLFRQVNAVKVAVRSSIVNRVQMLSDAKISDSPSNELSSTAEPHNDYFSTQFLLAFPVTGVHSVTIEVGVLDEQGALWQTGPRQILSVKSYDEAVQRQQQQQYAAQRQQQRAKTMAAS